MADSKVEEAAKELGLSKFTIYRMPKGTPGLYRYGRALRVNVPELKKWAKEQALEKDGLNRSEVDESLASMQQGKEN